MQLAEITVWQVKVLMIDWPRPWGKLCIIIHNCYFWLAWFVLDLWLRKQFEIISVLAHWQWWMNWILLVPNMGLDRKQITLATVVFCYWVSQRGKFVVYVCACVCARTCVIFTGCFLSLTVKTSTIKETMIKKQTKNKMKKEHLLL